MRINSKEPFKPVPGAPDPLVSRIRHRVLFGECDPMGVLWHGRYADLFSEAREELARSYGLTYAQFQEAGVALPIKTLFVDYQLPLVYEGLYTVEARLHWSEAARINISYRITDEREQETTTGFTVQLLLDASGGLLLAPPPSYRKFLDAWAAGTPRVLTTKTPRVPTAKTPRVPTVETPRAFVAETPGVSTA